MSIFLLTISLILGLIGVIGKTTNEDKKFPTNVKPLWYIVITLMFVSFVVTLIVQNQESRNRDIVAQTAYSELRNATFQHLAPYFIYTDPPWTSGEEEFNFNRPVKEYSSLGDESPLITNICDLDYRAEHPRSGRPVAYVMSDNMSRYQNKVADIISNYQSYLPNSLVINLSRITTHPWVDFNTTLKSRFNRQLRDQTVAEVMTNAAIKDKKSEIITCGTGPDRSHFLTMGKRFNKLLLEVENETITELNRIKRRGIESEEELLFVKRPFWYR